MAKAVRKDALVQEVIRKRKASGKSLKLRKPPAQVLPSGAEMSYFSELRKMVKAAVSLLKEAISKNATEIIERGRAHRKIGNSARADAVEDVDRIINGVKFRFQNLLSAAEIAAIARRIADRTEKQNFKNVASAFKKVLGVDILKSEPWLRAEIDDFVKENVDLITSIPNDYFDKVRRKVRASVTSGRPAEQLAKEIVGFVNLEGDKAMNRARLIARDQTFKFYGNLSQIRQTNLGLTKYIWRTKKDDRVRPEHREREGDIFSWDDPPEGGHPGEDYNCRCVPGFYFEGFE